MADYNRNLRSAKRVSGVGLHGSNPEPLMSALGQKETLDRRLLCPLYPQSGHGAVSFDYLIRDLMAPCRVDSGVPSNRDGERKREGRC